MLMFAIGCFIVAALFGLYLLSFVLQSKPTPKAIALVHGLFAVTGLVTLLYYAAMYTPAPVASITLFVLAALGGLTLIFRDLTGKSVPKWLALVHGSVALIAFVTLLIFALR